VSKELVISIVSHGQGHLVELLLADLAEIDFSIFTSVSTLVTLNIEEDEGFLVKYLDEIVIIRNVRPQGYGSNHNQAFSVSGGDFFVVMNPDIRVGSSFASHIFKESEIDWGCMAPRVLAPDGSIEDSARRYPSLFRIGERVLLNRRTPDYQISMTNRELIPVDWVAGMILIFKSSVYQSLKGFDDNYYMYLEDADICRRSNELGYTVVLNPDFSIIHDARRNSLKSARHFQWHLRSMIRFIFSI